MNDILQDAPTAAATFKPRPGDWQIQCDGTPVMGGDSTLKVVFFNLNGRNFKNPEPWRTQTHAEYLEHMRSVHAGYLLAGQTITLLNSDGTTEGKHRF